MKKQALLLISAVLILGCYQKAALKTIPFERETEVFKYFDCANIKIDENVNHIFIFQTDKCGSCTDEVLDYISTHFNNKEDKKTFILSSNTKVIVDMLRNIPNSTLLVDTNFDLGRNGLSYAQDLYFKFNNKKIESWCFLNHTTIKKL